MRQGGAQWAERSNLLVLSLGMATALFVGASVWLAAPLLPALTWSSALAITVYPAYCRLPWRRRRPNVTAAGVVVALGLVVIGPVLVLSVYAANQLRQGVQAVQDSVTSEKWTSMLQEHPRVARLVESLQDKVDVQGQLEAAAGEVGKALPGFLGGSIWLGVQLLVMFFLFFFFIRDRDLIVDWIKRIVPLSPGETAVVFTRIHGVIHAVIVGHFLTASAQGLLGGVMMAILGVPLPVLWGCVMALLSLIPTLGAPVVWIPAAVMLALQGSWGKALILAVWGACVIGLIDNVLYPILVGQRVTLHTVPIFLAFLGGIVVFGISGLVLGPLIVAMTWTLLEIWRRRTANGRAATEAVMKVEG